MFGNPETTTGGRALKFYASVRLDVRKIDVIKQGDAMLGSRTRVKVVKIKWLRRSNNANLILCTGKEYLKLESLTS